MEKPHVEPRGTESGSLRTSHPEALHERASPTLATVLANFLQGMRDTE